MKPIVLAVSFTLATTSPYVLAQTTASQDATCNDVGQRTADTCEKSHQASVATCQVNGANAQNDCMKHMEKHNAAYGPKPSGSGEQKGMD